MSDYRTASIRLHFARSGVYWALTLTDVQKRSHFDRRVHSGRLDYSTRSTAPEQVIRCLQRAVDELAARWGVNLSAQRPAPPEGDTGGIEPEQRPSPWSGHVSHGARCLDQVLPGL